MSDFYWNLQVYPSAHILLPAASLTSPICVVSTVDLLTTQVFVSVSYCYILYFLSLCLCLCLTHLAHLCCFHRRPSYHSGICQCFILLYIILFVFVPVSLSHSPRPFVLFPPLTFSPLRYLSVFHTYTFCLCAFVFVSPLRYNFVFVCFILLTLVLLVFDCFILFTLVLFVFVCFIWLAQIFVCLCVLYFLVSI